jgi:hypothetical protein
MVGLAKASTHSSPLGQKKALRTARGSQGWNSECQ